MPLHYNPSRIALRLNPTQPSSELVYCARLHRFLIETVEVLKRRYPRHLSQATVTLYGRHVDTARLAYHLKNDLLRSLVVLTLCLAFLMILSFRKVESILFIILPSCVGLAWAFGLITLFFNSITFLSAVFLTLLMALGVEYAVQIYHRFIEELYKERDYYSALGTAYSEAGRGLLVCTGITVLVFFSLYLGAFRGLRELALVGVIGILCITVSVLLLLPPMAALKSALARGIVRPLEMYGFGLRSLSAAVVSSPRTTLALGLIVTAGLALFSRDIRIRHEVGLDLGASHPEERLAGKKNEKFLSPGRNLYVMIEAPTLQKALEANDRPLCGPDLRHEIDLLHRGRFYQSLASFSRRNKRRYGSNCSSWMSHPSRSRFGWPPSDFSLKPDAFSPFTNTIENLVDLSRRLPLVEFDLIRDPLSIRRAQDHVIHDEDIFRVLTIVHMRSDAPRSVDTNLAALAMNEASHGVKGCTIRLDGETWQNQRVAQAVLFSLALTVLLALFSLFVCLWPHFHGRMEDVLLAILPLTCATVWTLGLFAFFHFRIGLHALLIFPLLIAIATDQAVLLMQRLRERHYASPRQALRTGGRANVVASLSLFIALGCPAQVNVQSLREMALVAAITIAFSTITTLTLIPALLQIRQEGGLGTWPADVED